MIEIDLLAKACGLAAFRYHAFPPVAFEAPKLPSMAVVVEPVPVAPGKLMEATGPRNTASSRVEPVFTMPTPVELETPALTMPDPPISAAAVLPAAPLGTASETAALWRARLQAGPALPSYQVLEDVAATLRGEVPLAPEAAPSPASTPTFSPRRKARSAGRAAISAMRPN